MQLDECVKRSFAAVEGYLNGDLQPHHIDDISIHRALLFPRKNPASGYRVNLQDEIGLGYLRRLSHGLVEIR